MERGTRSVMGEIKERILINAPISEVYNSYKDTTNWKYALSDVLDVETIYDDSFYQEFYMTVERNLKPETVRTIRFCEPLKTIELFQPDPPPQVNSMRGKWEFKAISSKVTEVTATRIYELKNIHENETYQKKLTEHLKRNLLLFKSFNEKVGVIEVSRYIPASKQEVFECFWDIKNWYKVWSPIEGVEVNFDDNYTQIFTMEVWRDGICEKVQTIRKRENDQITFTSPVAPPKLKEHSGSWIFKNEGEGAIVTATRNFQMDKEQILEDEHHALKNYKYNLQMRLLKILDSFVDYYEHKKGGIINEIH